MAFALRSTLLTTHLDFLLPRRSLSRSSPSVLPLKKRTPRLLRISATGSVDVMSPEVVIEKAQEIVPPAADDGVGSVVISVLLTVAFVGLSILTVGVIYISVTDFLRKRENEKFEKEEAAKKKPKKKKVKVKGRAAPRGFGVKVEDEDEEE